MTTRHENNKKRGKYHEKRKYKKNIPPFYVQRVSNLRNVNKSYIVDILRLYSNKTDKKINQEYIKLKSYLNIIKHSITTPTIYAHISS